VSEFPVIEVTGSSALRIEQLGTKAKFWFDHSQLGRCLCKITRPKTGEDWSERVAAEIAAQLDLPHARYELGIIDNQPCVVSPIFLPENCSLVHGNELLGETDPSYGGTNISQYKQTAHTLDAVWDTLHQSACDLPLNWTPRPGIKWAAEVFVGYLMLDALIGNTDRHHENWGVVEAPEQATARRHLAPTFDHASSLGCHILDAERSNRMRTADAGYSVSAYASKARSALYANPLDTHPMTTLHAFQSSAARWPRAAAIWLEVLATFTETHVARILSRFPANRLSTPSRDFALGILLHNRERLLSVTSER
jgi:hypothetical protein